MYQQLKARQKCRAFSQVASGVHFTAQQACQRHGNFKPQTCLLFHSMDTIRSSELTMGWVRVLKSTMSCLIQQSKL